MEVEFIVALIAGILSGVVSEIGGAGSLISLPMLIGVGLPPIVANGTNRVGVLFQYTMGYIEFRNRKPRPRLDLREAAIISIPVVVGTIVGALLAVSIKATVLNWMVVITMVITIISLSLGRSWDGSANTNLNPSKTAMPLDYLLLVGAGLYCGLIQSGMSSIMYLVLIKFLKVELKAAETLKFFMSMIVTPFALAIFIWNGHINWLVGLFLAIGSAIGGWIGAKMTESENSKRLKTIIMIAIVISVIYTVIFIQLHIQKGIYYI